MKRVIEFFQDVVRVIWGSEPAHPRYWNDRAEHDATRDDRARWFIAR